MRARGHCKTCQKSIELWGQPNRQFCDSLCRTIYHAKQDLLAQSKFNDTAPQRACEVCGCAYNPTLWERDKYCTETCFLIANHNSAKDKARRAMFKRLDYPQRYVFRDALAQARLDRALKRYAYRAARAQRKLEDDTAKAYARKLANARNVIAAHKRRQDRKG